MISISTAWLLIPFAVFLAGFAFFALVNIVHLFHYGASLTIGFLASLIFIAASAGILFMTWQGLADVDWGASFPLFGTSWAFVEPQL